MTFGFYQGVYNYNTRRQRHSLYSGYGLTDLRLAQYKEDWDNRCRKLDQAAAHRAVRLALLTPEERVVFLREERQERFRQQWKDAEWYGDYDDYYRDEHQLWAEMRLDYEKKCSHAMNSLIALDEYLGHLVYLRKTEEARELAIELEIYDVSRETEEAVPFRPTARGSRRLLPTRWRTA